MQAYIIYLFPSTRNQWSDMAGKVSGELAQQDISWLTLDEYVELIYWLFGFTVFLRLALSPIVIAGVSVLWRPVFLWPIVIALLLYAAATDQTGLMKVAAGAVIISVLAYCIVES